jgi:hypothetical protein
MWAAWYRGLGADGPFGDPRRAHGVGMEGYFWRFTDVRGGRVVVALCGVSRSAAGTWANLALAAHPGGLLRSADVAPADADERRLGVRAGERAFAATPDRVRLDLGSDARLDVRLSALQGWTRRPFGGSGAAHALPGLSQYWHPHVLGGRADGEAILGEQRFELAGAAVYAEKNWGRGGFPERWWWGQAHGFARPDVCVAFAGGTVGLGPARLRATALACRIGDTLIRLGDPIVSPVHAEIGPGRWRMRARGPRWSAELDGRAAPDTAHTLPVPLPGERRSVPGAHQHLAGDLRLTVRRRGRVVFSGESPLAGLEQGDVTAPHTASVLERGRRAIDTAAR